ncbi:MAG: Smr/MutS family protein, partial [Gemmatimonadota bacterium]|nr:Smr/MutS family protein [Gemmatimonadota bacterium]
REQRAAVRAGASSRSSDVRVAPGDRVRIRSTGGKGRVVEVRARRASVEVGAMRMEIPVHELEPLEGAAPQPEERGSAGRGHGGWSGPEAARMEVDLRGLRVDELVLALSRALDDAVLEDLADLRIIHGKGTGALRQRTQELLAGDSRVVSYRMGGPTEGGAGVTVVSFR